VRLLSIKSQREYLFKKAAIKLLTDEMYDDIENFSVSNKIKAEIEYQDNKKLVMTRVVPNGFKTILIYNGKEMNIVKQ
jgi:hypothetical protein